MFLNYENEKSLRNHCIVCFGCKKLFCLGGFVWRSYAVFRHSITHMEFNIKYTLWLCFIFKTVYQRDDMKEMVYYIHFYEAGDILYDKTLSHVDMKL